MSLSSAPSSAPTKYSKGDASAHHNMFMSQIHPLPLDAALMDLDAKSPFSALEILRNAGEESLEQEYVKACEALNRYGKAFMTRHLESDLSPEEFSEELNQHTGFQAAKLSKEAVRTRIERIREEAQNRMFHRTAKF